MKRRALCLAALFASACTRDLSLPPVPPPPGPGTLYGRIVYPLPGQSDPAVAAGAPVQILGTSLSTTAGADGRFLLAGITRSSGQVLFQVDTQGVGTFDRQRLFNLADLGAGPGRQIGLGDVAVGEDAQMHGRVLLGDREGQRGGQGGTTVFVPEGPYTTYTNDDGSWNLPGLPQGPIRVSVFHPLYDSVALDFVDLGSGQDYGIRDIVLRPAPGSGQPGTIAGGVTFIPPLSSASGTSIQLASGGVAGVQAQAADDGTFRVPGVDPGLYSVTAAHAGYTPATVFNVLVQSGRVVNLPDIVLSTNPALDSGVGPPDAGGADAGPGSDAGQDAGTDSGQPLANCDGGCAAGLTCAQNRCVSQSCPNTLCAPGFACEDGGCEQGACVGVQCPPASGCGNGSCFPTACASGDCDGGLCWQGACVSPECAGLSCGARQVCEGGACWPSCGSGCSPATVCVAGACVPGCTIGSVAYAANTFNPGSACQICDPTRDPGAWSDITSGSDCPNGICALGACGPGCAIQGTGYPAGANNPGYACEVCTPALNVTGWSAGNDNLVCPGGGFCRGGTCANGCEVDGGFVPPGDADPQNSCQSCQPARASVSYSPVTDGTACSGPDGGDFCSSAACVAACSVNGALYAPGAPNPALACSTCEPPLNPTGFSPVTGLVPPGVACPSGEDVCQGGACTRGCFISGAFEPPLMLNPDAGSTKMCCAPAFSVASWSAEWQMKSFGAGNGLNEVRLLDLGNPRGLDMVASSGTDLTVTVSRNLGNGAFGPAVIYPVATPPNSKAVAVASADVDGDGLADLVIMPNTFSNSIPGQPLQIDLGLADGGYGAPTLVPMARDMLIGASTHFFPGRDGGAVFMWNQTNNAIEMVGVGPDGGLQILNSQPVPFNWVNPQPGTAAVVADLNGDGLDDLAVMASGLYVMLNDGNGHLGAVASYLQGNPYQALAAAPFLGHTHPNGKPVLDLVTGFQNASVYIQIWQNDGAGSFSLAGSPGTLNTVFSLAAGDFNGDGFQDVAASNASNQILMYYGDGTGSLKQGQTLVPGPPGAQSGYLLASGPVGVNGTTALAAIIGPNTVALWQNACAP